MGKEWFKGHYDFGGGMPIRNLAIMVFGVLIQRHWPRYWTG